MGLMHMFVQRKTQPWVRICVHTNPAHASCLCIPGGQFLWQYNLPAAMDTHMLQKQVKLATIVFNLCPCPCPCACISEASCSSSGKTYVPTTMPYQARPQMQYCVCAEYMLDCFYPLLNLWVPSVAVWGSQGATRGEEKGACLPKFPLTVWFPGFSGRLI